MKYIVFLSVIMLSATSLLCHAKPLKKIKVEVNAGQVERMNTIASLDLSSYEIPSGYTVQVKRTDGQSPCLSQLEYRGESKTLYWRIDGQMIENETRMFLIEQAPVDTQEAPIIQLTRDKGGNFLFAMNQQNMFQYNTEMSRLPSFVDSAYRRNGYIHPVYSPKGSILTEVSPADHLHHYGIWNPWTFIVYDNKKYDLWNIGNKTGTVRFDSVYSTASGQLFASIQVRHRHIIYQEQAEQVVNTVQGIYKYTPKQEVVIMNEKQELRAWNTGDNIFAWDLVSDLSPATTLPVLMKAYRYGGFGFRATPDWQKDNCRMLTSEGKTRQEIDGTRARWIYIIGDNAQRQSGILFLASPQNHNFPEPLRVWDATANNGRGDVMLNFAPSKFEDWLLESGKQYRLKYRIVTFDGELTAQQAELLWQDFANLVEVRIK